MSQHLTVTQNCFQDALQALLNGAGVFSGTARAVETSTVADRECGQQLESSTQLCVASQVNQAKSR